MLVARVRVQAGAPARDRHRLDYREVAARAAIDVTNRMTFGPNGPAIDNGDSNAERLAAWLPNAHVVKAFNTVFASHQADPIADGQKLDGFVAGDDRAQRTPCWSWSSRSG